ncbi:hypothetical protein LCI18_014704 [Fusarium solani-melongenae]|uniref:Uncharacterized protein n=1 Tax=Fusarium solani subsp. cucurbitae TaxID=2747967 RepID=A0ACD3ZR09_FUSSC|nr:hypothetical protein LCI18_014704 [Fusarium solani-melongenae]
MGALTPEERTRLRAQQIQRLHAAHVEKGPRKFAEAITTADLNLARTLEPAWKHLGTDESEYPENWTLKKASLETVLRSFRRNAQQLIPGHVPDEVDVRANSKDQDQVANKTVATEATGNPPFPFHVNHQEIIPAPLARKHTDQDYQEKDEDAEDSLDDLVSAHFDHNDRDRSVRRNSPYPAFISGGLGPIVDHEIAGKATGFDFLSHSSSSRHGHHEPEVPQGNTNQPNMTMIGLQALVGSKDKEFHKMDNIVANLNKEWATLKQVAGDKEKFLQDTVKKLDAAQKKLRQSEKDKLVLIDEEQELVDMVKNMKL